MSKSTKTFQTEVQQLLDLVIHSLYTKKEIYLRELISNASDAMDRLKFEGLTNDKLLEGDSELFIKLTPDKDTHSIVIEDNGIGMSAEELDTNLGTIANSGTKGFLKSLQEAKEQGVEDNQFIGQFGVGFYAAFMIAERVEVETRRAGETQGYKWESAGDGQYSVEDVDKESRGTKITLYLPEDGKYDEYLEEWRIKNIVKQYSDYITYPIKMDVTKTDYPQAAEGEDAPEPVTTIEEETLNSMKPIWRRSKSELTADDYNEFYKRISFDYTDPLEVIHYVAEGVTEFRSILFIPGMAPMDMFSREQKNGLQLYVKNIFITDECSELLPEYMRFIKGVVDSSDLPLNVSREMLQDDAIIRRIRKSLVNKVLSTLKDLKNKDADKYLKFWEHFGKVIKEGIHLDMENREKLNELVLFPSSKTELEKPVSLKEYVERMPEGQEEIYYISGESYEAVKASPHLEALNSKGYEVLFFIDPIDEWVAQSLTEYDGKKLKAIDRGDLDLDSEDEKKEKEEKLKGAEEEYKGLLETIQKDLDATVKEVRLSSRLTESAVCLVADEHGMNANMERIMKAMGQEFQPSKRILEVNPEHPVLSKMRELSTAGDVEKVKDYSSLLLNQALLAEGSPIQDPNKFSKLISELMVQA